MAKIKEGSLILLQDNKGKRYLFILKKGGVFSFHKGKVLHDEILKKKIGEIIFSSKGEKLFILKPTLSDFVLKRLKRISQILYPKDIGQILILADIFEGAKVLEVGTGSGALTLCLIRAVGEKGKVVSVDEREDMIEIAKRNIEEFYQKKIREIKNLKIIRSNLKDVKEKNFDRIILDLPNPWDYLKKTKEILTDGGILACWLPTVIQVFKLTEKVDQEFSNYFLLENIVETFQREWQKREIALRPKDRMVAHTGFLVLFRKISATIIK